MMNQIVATFKSVEASYTSIKASSQRQALAVQIGGDQKPSNLLNNQQQQIVDEVGISEGALQKFEDAQALISQLQGYLNYLNGNGSALDVRITEANDEADVTIAARETNIAASIEVATYKEENIELTADFDDNGNLTSLSVSKETISAEYIKASYIVEDKQFFAQFSA